MENTLKDMRSNSAALAYALALILSPCCAFGSESTAFRDLLRRHAERSENSLESELRSGTIAASLHHRAGEVAVFGAVRIPVTVEFYLDRFRDIAAFKKGAEVSNVVRFGDHPVEQTLASLSLEPKETLVLGGCRPGKCGIKLSIAMMNQLRVVRGFDAVNKAFRKVLREYVAKYIQEGTPAMISYADRDPATNSSSTFSGILSEFTWLRDYAPGLADALNGPYRSADGQLEEFFYWSKEDFGLKPVISFTHVFIYKTLIDGRLWAFIASKQIYADHYLEGSLGLTVLAAEAADKNTPLLSMAYFNRSVTDGLRGWFSSISRAIVERRAREALDRHLAATKQQLASSYRQHLH